MVPWETIAALQEFSVLLPLRTSRVNSVSQGRLPPVAIVCNFILYSFCYRCLVYLHLDCNQSGQDVLAGYYKYYLNSLSMFFFNL